MKQEQLFEEIYAKSLKESNWVHPKASSLVEEMYDEIYDAIENVVDEFYEDGQTGMTLDEVKQGVELAVNSFLAHGRIFRSK